MFNLYQDDQIRKKKKNQNNFKMIQQKSMETLKEKDNIYSPSNYYTYEVMEIETSKKKKKSHMNDYLKEKLIKLHEEHKVRRKQLERKVKIASE